MIHDGHRKRLKAKLKAAPKSLEDHELIELLLYYSIPRKNTNEEAHKLIKRFGSVKGVFDTGLVTLQQVEGIGENSALLIKLVAELISRYALSEPPYEKTPLESSNALRCYLTNLFLATDVEMCYLVLFDRNRRLIGTHLLSTGDSNGTTISMQKIAELVSDRRTAYAIMAHNHPNGIAKASVEDIEVTNAINNFLKPLHIQFIEHFVVVGDICVPIKNSSMSYKYLPNHLFETNTEKQKKPKSIKKRS